MMWEQEDYGLRARSIEGGSYCINTIPQGFRLVSYDRNGIQYGGHIKPSIEEAQALAERWEANKAGWTQAQPSR